MDQEKTLNLKAQFSSIYILDEKFFLHSDPLADLAEILIKILVVNIGS